jgi:hypothetical protein
MRSQSASRAGAIRLARSRRPGLASASVTSRSASGNGSGRSSTPFTIEKVVVVSPMPSARVKTVVRVKVRRRTSARHACVSEDMVGWTGKTAGGLALRQ